MIARIYRPSKTAMQSGRAKAAGWVLEFEPSAARQPERLMGWTVTTDTTSSQVKLSFEAREDAVRYAEAHGIAFQIVEPAASKRILKAYADNFAFGRKTPWTH